MNDTLRREVLLYATISDALNAPVHVSMGRRANQLFDIGMKFL